VGVLHTKGISVDLWAWKQKINYVLLKMHFLIPFRILQTLFGWAMTGCLHPESVVQSGIHRCAILWYIYKERNDGIHIIFRKPFSTSLTPDFQKSTNNYVTNCKKKDLIVQIKVECSGQQEIQQFCSSGKSHSKQDEVEKDCSHSTVLFLDVRHIKMPPTQYFS